VGPEFSATRNALPHAGPPSTGNPVQKTRRNMEIPLIFRAMQWPIGVEKNVSPMQRAEETFQNNQVPG